MPNQEPESGFSLPSSQRSRPIHRHHFESVRSLPRDRARVARSIRAGIIHWAATPFPGLPRRKFASGGNLKRRGGIRSGEFLACAVLFELTFVRAGHGRRGYSHRASRAPRRRRNRISNRRASPTKRVTFNTRVPGSRPSSRS